MTQSPPPHYSIAAFWREKSEFARAMENAPACFACCNGTYSWYRLERAHIVAKSQGGGFNEGNYMLLCPQCHREQPMFSDREMVIEWARKHPHFSDWIAKLLNREATFYGPNFLYTEQDIKRAQEFMRLKTLRFHPNASLEQKASAIAYAIREYVKLRDQVFSK